MRKYKIGLRNKQALCVTLPKIAQEKGYIKGVMVEWVEMPFGLLLKLPNTEVAIVAPTTPLEKEAIASIKLDGETQSTP